MKKTFHKSEIQKIASEVLDFVEKNKKEEGATILTLSGDLGAGKTTLTQALAKELGVKENVISPTFILMKSYELKSKSHKQLVHIDAYRFDSHKELEKIGFAEIISNKGNLVLLEWPEKVNEVIPDSAIKVRLTHKNEEEREIEY